MFRKFTGIVQTRWKYLLTFYIFGYAISLYDTGVPNIYYLIPIKATAVGLGWALGASISHRGCPTWVISVVYTLSGILMAATVAILVTIVCWVLKIDPMPFYGSLDKVSYYI